MDLSEDADRLLAELATEPASPVPTDAVATMLDGNIDLVMACLDYLVRNGWITIAPDETEGTEETQETEAITITDAGHDHLAQLPEPIAAMVASDAVVRDIQGETVVVQQNINSDHPTQHAPPDATTPFTYDVDLGVIDRLAHIYRVLINYLSTIGTTGLSVVSTGLGAIGFVDYLFPTVLATTGYTRLGLGFVSLVLLTFGGGYFLTRTRYRCEDCDELFASFPTGTETVVDQHHKTDDADLVAIEEHWECRACGHETTKPTTRAADTT